MESILKYKQLDLKNKIQASDLAFSPISCLQNEETLVKSTDPVYGDNVFLVTVKSHIGVYHLDVTANTRILIDISKLELSNRIITFELHFRMVSLNSIMLPANVRFAAPINMNELKTYVLVMRSTSDHSEWIVNQAYAY